MLSISTFLLAVNSEGFSNHITPFSILLISVFPVSPIAILCGFIGNSNLMNNCMKMW